MHTFKKLPNTAPIIKKRVSNIKISLKNFSKIADKYKEGEMELEVQFFKKDDRYIVFSPQLNLYAEGNTPNQAVERLQKIINFYLASATEPGVNLGDLCFPPQN